LKFRFWNDAVVAAAWSKETPKEHKPLIVYAASKVEGEREAWKCVKENQPGFIFNTILPNMNVRAVVHIDGVKAALTQT
jgi:nucleoside-diphosphate-sugar epimerase